MQKQPRKCCSAGEESEEAKDWGSGDESRGFAPSVTPYMCFGASRISLSVV